MPEWTVESIQQSLSKYQTLQDKDQSWVKLNSGDDSMAAVLVLLVNIEKKWSCVFIERALNPKDIHSGQIAFPGGRTEAVDFDLIDTAIRETQEEIGIKVSRNDIIGLLPTQISRKNYKVRPVVAVTEWPQKTVLQTSEVADLFLMPINWFEGKENRESATVLGLQEGATIVYKEYNKKRVWGLTAKIIDELLTVLN